MKILKNLNITKIAIIIFILLIPAHMVLFIFYSETFVETEYLQTNRTVQDCTVPLNNVLNEEFDSDLKIKYVDKYVFPEIQNINCIGKIQNIIYENDEIEVIVYRSPRLHFLLIGYLGFVSLFILFFNKFKKLDLFLLIYILFYLYTIENFQYKSYFLPSTFLILIFPYFLIKSNLYKENKNYINLTEKIKKYGNMNIIFWGAISILLIERFLWTNVSSWGLDQMTHIWVGYQYPINEIPVGNISSRYIPNPNGLVIIGKLLSFLPNLRAVSFFLTIFQMAIILLIHYSIPKEDRKSFSILTLSYLSSIYLINASVEFWGQYMLLNVNLLFIYWLVTLIINKNPNKLVLLAFLALLAPSFYLVGFITGIVITIVGLFALVKYSDFTNFDLRKQLIYIIGIIGAFLYFVWIPYAYQVNINDFLNFEKAYDEPRLTVLFQTLINFPLDLLFQWSEVESYKVSLLMFAEPNNILSTKTRYLQFTNLAIHGLFGISLLIQIIFLILNKEKKEPVSVYKKIVDITLITLIISYLFSPLLGSYRIGNNENPSVSLQYYPFFILIIFLFPFIYKKLHFFKKIFIPINKYLFGVFILLNILLSHSVYSDHINYDGPRLTNADVPYSHKMEALDFIVDDWRKISTSEIIPVYYDFDKIVYRKWITGFGYRITKWYDAPFTHGREFDYELSKKYGLTNSQEGLQWRSPYRSKYIISYGSLSPPDLKGKVEEHHKVGRLRVTILSDEK